MMNRALGLLVIAVLEGCAIHPIQHELQGPDDHVFSSLGKDVVLLDGVPNWTAYCEVGVRDSWIATRFYVTDFKCDGHAAVAQLYIKNTFIWDTINIPFFGENLYEAFIARTKTPVFGAVSAYYIKLVSPTVPKSWLANPGLAGKIVEVQPCRMGATLAGMALSMLPLGGGWMARLFALLL